MIHQALDPLARLDVMDFVMDNEDDFLINQDPHPYLFGPEHTEEELQVLEEERLRLLNSKELRRDSEPTSTGGVVVGHANLCLQQRDW